MADLPALYVGTISGTSVDGLDLALLDLSSQPRLVAATTHAFPDTLREELLAVGQPGNDDLDRIGALDAALGDFIGTAITTFLAASGRSRSEVAAIGSHGQTIRHRPDADHPFTWQIGDPNRIAERTGITTVADFRRRDMAAGGQGAPLVPAFHAALFRSPAENRVIANIGGIGNLTYLASDPTVAVSGFDAGPGNGLMDAWIARHDGSAFDADGSWASSGRVIESLLEAMLEDAYFQRPPPKSTGREAFNLPWLEAFSPASHAPEDVQRTLLELTVRSLVIATERYASPCDRFLVCGGGRENGLLMTRLAELLPCPVAPSEALDVDGDALEAAAFAWLAAQRLREAPGNAPAVTGAARDRVLGAVYPA
ncbi:MAG: anhydro-N-acetylmuramic acid kinase [Pseudomonadota bacterium]